MQKTVNTRNHGLVLFNPWIGPLRARVYLVTMAINVYSTFTKAPALVEPHHQIV